MFLIAAGAAVALHLAWQMPWPPWQWLSSAGVILVLAGLLLMLWSAIALYRRGTSPLPWVPSNTVVSTGPYRFSRNPIYLGDVLLLAGIGCWLGIGWLVLAAAVSVPVFTRSVVVHEEAYLAERFPEAWAEYSGRVRRWL